MSKTRKTIVVIGGGHNGLATATALAKAGRQVVLLEARERVGGLAERYSFHEGYEVAGILHDTSAVRPEIVDRLDLQRHGLAWRSEPLRICAPRRKGNPVWLRGSESVDGELEDGDAERFARWRSFLERVRPAVMDLLNAPPQDPQGAAWPLLMTGLKVRRLGAADMIELIRVLPMCAADWLRDTVKTERLQAALSLPAVEASFSGPWSAGTAATLLLRELSGGRQIIGGGAALCSALAKAARAQGVTTRCDATVSQITVSGGAVSGVVLQDGERIEADIVAASCDPKQTFLKLVGPQRISVGLASDIRNVRARGTTAKVHLALDGPLELADSTQIEALRTGETLDEVERAYDAAKYREFAKRPVLDVRVPTLEDRTLAPEGHHVVSMMVHAAAHDLDGGWTDEARAALGDAAVDVLAEVCPSVTERIVAREVLTPVDLQKRYRLSGGHLHHGEHALDQLMFMRPTIECATYHTAIEGLFLCGSGSHPGGGLSCAPGVLAANAILR